MQDPLSLYALPYRLFLSRNTVFLDNANAFEIFRGRFVQPKSSADTFDLSQFKFYFFFKFFFFREFANKKGAFLFNTRKRKGRRLSFKRYRKSFSVFLRKASLSGFFLHKTAPAYKLARFLAYKPSAQAFAGEILGFIHAYFFFFFCSFKKNPLKVYLKETLQAFVNSFYKRFFSSLYKEFLAFVKYRDLHTYGKKKVRRHRKAGLAGQ